MGVVVRRYLDFFILLILTPLVFFFCGSIPTMFIYKCFFVLYLIDAVRLDCEI